MESEQHLILSAREGNSAAWRTLFERDREMVYQIAYRIVMDREDALDIMQESFCKAFLNLHRFQIDGAWRAWLRTITVRTALSRIRRLKRLTLLMGKRSGEFEYANLSGGVESATEDLEHSELRDALHDALNSLSPRQRAVATLYFEQELSLPEIADITGIRRQTVKVHLHRARKALQKLLNEYNLEGASND